MGQREARHPERAADRHRADEGRGDQPERAAAEQRRIETDRHHGEHMVEPADRMDQAVREAAGRAGAGMRERRAGRSNEGGGRGRDARNEERHGWAFYSGAGSPE